MRVNEARCIVELEEDGRIDAGRERLRAAALGPPPHPCPRPWPRPRPRPVVVDSAACSRVSALDARDTPLSERFSSSRFSFRSTRRSCWRSAAISSAAILVDFPHKQLFWATVAYMPLATP